MRFSWILTPVNSINGGGTCGLPSYLQGLLHMKCRCCAARGLSIEEQMAQHVAGRSCHGGTWPRACSPPCRAGGATSLNTMKGHVHTKQDEEVGKAVLRIWPRGRRVRVL